GPEPGIEAREKRGHLIALRWLELERVDELEIDPCKPTLPKPKPRIWSPMKGDVPCAKKPTFWYRFRKCGTLTIPWLARLVPSGSAWQNAQGVSKNVSSNLVNSARPAASSAVGTPSSRAIGFGG